MSEDIKSLIEKIQQDGVEAAEKKARQIEDKAAADAAAVIKEAQKKAALIVEQAREEAAKMEKGAQASMEQTARDMLISLRREIEATLERIIVAKTRQALDSDELKKIITSLAKEADKKESDVIVTLSKKDIEKLDKEFTESLSEELKKGIKLRASGEINAGLIISYDGGKSHFDFSDKALAEFLGRHLKKSLAEILTQAAEGKKNK